MSLQEEHVGWWAFLRRNGFDAKQVVYLERERSGVVYTPAEIEQAIAEHVYGRRSGGD